DEGFRAMITCPNSMTQSGNLSKKGARGWGGGGNSIALWKEFSIFGSIENESDFFFFFYPTPREKGKSCDGLSCAVFNGAITGARRALKGPYYPRQLVQEFLNLSHPLDR